MKSKVIDALQKIATSIRKEAADPSQIQQQAATAATAATGVASAPGVTAPSYMDVVKDNFRDLAKGIGMTHEYYRTRDPKVLESIRQRYRADMRGRSYIDDIRFNYAEAARKNAASAEQARVNVDRKRALDAAKW